MLLPLRVGIVSAGALYLALYAPSSYVAVLVFMICLLASRICRRYRLELSAAIASSVLVFASTAYYAGSLLHLAVSKNSVALTRMLLLVGVDKEARSRLQGTAWDLSPLQLASFLGSYDTARLLLEFGASVYDSGRPAISLAAKSGRMDILDALLSFGADPNHEGVFGLKPLDYTLIGQGCIDLSHAQTAAVERLLKAGADPNKKSPPSEEKMRAGITDGVGPMYWAFNYRRLDSIRRLIEYGADVNQTHFGETIEEHLDASGLGFPTCRADATALRSLVHQWKNKELQRPVSK